jgi:hypothetical protein
MSKDIAIVIPGGPRGTADRISAALKPYRILKERGYNVHIIPTGIRLHETIHKSLLDYGILEEEIIIEPYANSTEENVINSARICKDNGWTNVLFATSYYQAKRIVKEINEHVPNDWNVGWVYEEPELSDIKYEAFLFARYTHELGASIKDLFGNNKNTNTAKKAVETLLKLEGKIFKRIGFG